MVLPNYLLELDATTWGWIHLIVGIVVALAGFSVLIGADLGPSGRDPGGVVERHRQLRLHPLLPDSGRF